MERRSALLRLSSYWVLAYLDASSWLAHIAAAETITVSVRLRLPGGFDQTRIVPVDPVTVFDRVNGTCAVPGQQGEGHAIGMTALAAFHRAVDAFGLPSGGCADPYELAYYPSYGGLYLRAADCIRERCQVLGWRYSVNAQFPPVGMDQWPISNGDALFVDFLPLPTGMEEPQGITRPFTMTVGPNPLQDHATVLVQLPQDADLSIDVYNTKGQHIRCLVDRRRVSSGIFSALWDGTDHNGDRAASGLYFLRVTEGSTYQGIIRKLIVRR